MDQAVHSSTSLIWKKIKMFYSDVKMVLVLWRFDLAFLIIGKAVLRFQVVVNTSWTTVTRLRTAYLSLQ